MNDIRPPRTDYFREREAFDRKVPSITDSAASSLSTNISKTLNSLVSANSSVSSLSLQGSRAINSIVSANSSISSLSLQASTAASSLSLATSTAVSTHTGATDPHTQYNMYAVVTYNATGNIATTALRGQVGKITGAYTLSLPTATVNYHGSFFASTAAVFSIDVLTATDITILDGVALAAGHKVTSDGTLGATVFIECTEAGYYRATSILGVFADGGV